jgi:hypothetical protein
MPGLPGVTFPRIVVVLVRRRRPVATDDPHPIVDSDVEGNPRSGSI